MLFSATPSSFLLRIYVGTYLPQLSEGASLPRLGRYIQTEAWVATSNINKTSLMPCPMHLKLRRLKVFAHIDRMPVL